MSRPKSPHHYLIKVGPGAGKIFEGFQCGMWNSTQEYEDWEAAGRPTINLYDGVRKQGIWIPALNAKIDEPRLRAPKDAFSDEGVDYGDFVDLCTPFDRFGDEIAVDDTLYAAVSNEVREVTVTKIANAPYLAGYGIYQRKLTVVDDMGQKLTINDHRATVKKNSLTPDHS